MKERIKKLRKFLKISQEEFGSKIGISGAGVSKIEIGKNALTEQNIKAIVREFNVSRLWLTEGQGEMFIEPDDDLLGRISDLFLDKNDPAIALFKAFAAFDKEDWLVVQKIIDQIKKKP